MYIWALIMKASTLNCLSYLTRTTRESHLNAADSLMSTSSPFQHPLFCGFGRAVPSRATGCHGRAN
jgi:hypothetical protein